MIQPTSSSAITHVVQHEWKAQRKRNGEGRRKGLRNEKKFLQWNFRPRLHVTSLPLRLAYLSANRKRQGMRCGDYEVTQTIGKLNWKAAEVESAEVKDDELSKERTSAHTQKHTSVRSNEESDVIAWQNKMQISFLPRKQKAKHDVISLIASFRHCRVSPFSPYSPAKACNTPTRYHSFILAY